MANVSKTQSTFRVDHYHTTDKSEKTVVTGGMPERQLPGGVSASVAMGKDVRMDRTPCDDPTVVDVHLKRPLGGGFALRGRVRTSYSKDSSSTQFRGGLQYSYDVTNKDTAYAQVYVADKVKYKPRESDFSVGAFAGVEHRFNDRFSAYAEVQAYDFGSREPADLGVNAGFRMTF